MRLYIFKVFLPAALFFQSFALLHASNPSSLDVISSTPTVQLKLKGHINRAMMFADNGFSTRLLHVDNDSSSTRFGAHATADVTCDFTMGANMVVELQSNNSEVIDIFDNDSAVSFKQRTTEIYLDSDCWGRLTLGYGATRSDTTSENDLSGTDMVALGASIDSFAGGLRFREAKTSAGPQIIDVHNGMDGLSKNNRVRYDSPELYGWSFGASHATQNSGDIGLNFNGEVECTKIQASAVLLHKTGQYAQASGSAAFLFQNGISVSIAGGQRFRLKTHDRRPSMYHGKIGYSFDMCSLGQSHFAIDHGRAHHLLKKHDHAHSSGMFFVQDVDRAANEIYIGIRNHYLHRPGARFKSIKATMLGARVRF